MSLTTNSERMAKLFARCGAAVSRLEMLCDRDPGLPDTYRTIVAEAYDSLRTLDKLSRELVGPWRVAGLTEDGRMHRIVDDHGYEVARVHGAETAEALVAISHMFRARNVPKETQ